MQKEDILYSDLKARKALLGIIVKRTAEWRKFAVLRSMLYSLSFILFGGVIFWVTLVTESQEEFLTAIEVYFFVALALAAIPWAFCRGRLPRVYTKAGQPFTCRANETISIDNDKICYSYGNSGKWKVISSKKKDIFIDVDIIECCIAKKDIQAVEINNGVCKVIGPWECKSKHVESIDFDVMMPEIKERTEVLPDFSFLLDFKPCEVNQIIAFFDNQE